MFYSAPSKDQSILKYCQFSAFDHPYLSCNDHLDWWFFQEISIIIPKKFLWTILNLFSWNLNTFTKLTEQVCFLFVCSFFTLNTLDESVLFLLIINALQLLNFFASQAVQKRKLKALIWPPIHFVVKFNKHMNMKNLFVSIIVSENNKQYLVYFYKHVAFLRVFI